MILFIYTVKEMPKISIIIRTKNEEWHLPEVFDALLKQTFQDF